MNIYLDGKNNIVAIKDSTTLTIPQSRAKYFLVGTYPFSTIEDYTQVKIVDLLNNDFLLDDIVNTTDNSGNSYTTTAAVQTYLSTIMFYSDFQKVGIDFSTAANQETIINQNTEIDSKLNELNILQEDSQEIIKKELQENNKFLRKIYN